MSLVTKTQSGSDAIFSPCGLYRYRLTRYLAPAKTPYIEKENLIVWLMFNPSTADATRNDATIRRVIGFSKRWGYTFSDIYNLFAFRSTHPGKLGRIEDPIGPHNEEYLKLIPYDVVVVAAWGGILPGGRRLWANWFIAVRKMLAARNTFTLGMCANGKDPRHPLMLPYSAQLQKWDVIV